MNTITLDPRLRADCFVLGRLSVSHLLLMNNRLFPWLILVPETPKTELYELDPAMQRDLLADINRISERVKSAFPVDKLNVAAIGNVVSQLHVHVIGRSTTDPCWPGVVWGSGIAEPYEPEERDRVIRRMTEGLTPDVLRPSPWTGLPF
jgi:diadenosine tetraphosphate (Ap4A) HIT family hydrolase